MVQFRKNVLTVKEFMKKIIFFIIVALIAILILSSCSSHNDMDYKDNDSPSSGEAADTEDNTSISERKIIHEVNASLSSSNINDTLSKIKGGMLNDEWIETESTSKDHSTITLRIKTERLEAFITSISEEGAVYNLERKSTDVSLSYYDKTGRIESLEAERTRLNELYSEMDSPDALIVINKRIAEINLEIASLQGQVNQIDSLIDYSKVTLYISKAYEVQEEVTFSKRIKNVFNDSWKALGAFIKFLAVAVVAVFPFALVFAPIGIGIYYLNRYIKNKKKNKEKKPD